jgi:hypothetical protein
MDLAIIETGNGGELKLLGNDFAMQGGWGNMPYLAMFGGNPQGVTKEKLPTEESLDWRGNNLLMPQDKSIQFNSLTERTLMEVALNSSGRLKIEQAVKKDLEFMEAFAEIKVSVTIPAVDKVKIDIRVQQPENLQGRIPDIYKQYIFIWDATKQVLGDFRLLDFNNDYKI